MTLATQIDTGFDGHIHTSLCQHATGQMEDYVQAAIDKKLHTICFLEHMETGISYQPRSWLTTEDFRYYFSEGNRLRERYKDKINILLGVEAGINPAMPKEVYSRIAKLPVDRIGLSRHFFQIGNEHYNLLSRKKRGLSQLLAFGRNIVLDDYFTSILEVLHDIHIDVVCHLDAALRHVPDITLTTYHYSLIEQILDVMSQKDIALEVNTSGFTLRNNPFPNRDILQMAQKKHIRLQAGSDAHSPEQVGRDFNSLLQYLKSIGT
ncbi:histidinol-phosphatase [Desulfogranum japonicum]|uniref:histidinol-phosphatase n=1 Tax=Desulfogranum japonicum TaxID=231447 RepID=UPI000428DAFA|nr:histidinol-phosphatase [Desulfogranum japonicum]